MIIQILSVIALLSLSAFFSASESALFSLSAVQVEFYQNHPNIYRRLKVLLGNAPKLLVTILLGNESVNILVATLVATFLYQTHTLSEDAMAFASLAVTSPLLLLFGEIPPKMFALKMSEAVTNLVVFPLYYVYRFLEPISNTVVKINHFFFKLFTGKSYVESRPSLSEQEILQIIHLYEEDGVIDEFEKSVIQKILSFSDVPVLKIMTPMNRVIKISTQNTIDEIILVFKKRDFLRVPVIDPKRQNQIVGIFHCKEILRLKAKMAEGKSNIDWKDHIIQPLKVNYRINLEQLFNRFRRNRNHFALIFDDQQKCIGVITLDDILRHLFGSTATIGN